MDATQLSNLRTDVPVYNTPELYHHWRRAQTVIEDLHEQFVPCALTLGTRRILFQTILAMNAREVLEIGTFTGTSTLAFALAVRKTLGRVVTVDINDVNGNNGHWRQVGKKRTPRELLSEAGADELVDFVTMDSVAFLENSKRQFDFIVLDGWHEEEAVYKELPLAIARLNPNGLIFMDDIQVAGPPPGFDVIEGPWKALERHLMEDLGIKADFLCTTLEGEHVATAFITRDDKAC